MEGKYKSKNHDKFENPVYKTVSHKLRFDHGKEFVDGDAIACA